MRKIDFFVHIILSKQMTLVGFSSGTPLSLAICHVQYVLSVSSSSGWPLFRHLLLVTSIKVSKCICSLVSRYLRIHGSCDCFGICSRRTPSPRAKKVTQPSVWGAKSCAEVPWESHWEVMTMSRFGNDTNMLMLLNRFIYSLVTNQSHIATELLSH